MGKLGARLAAVVLNVWWPLSLWELIWHTQGHLLRGQGEVWAGPGGFRSRWTQARAHFPFDHSFLASFLLPLHSHRFILGLVTQRDSYGVSGMTAWADKQRSLDGALPSLVPAKGLARQTPLRRHS